MSAKPVSAQVADSQCSRFVRRVAGVGDVGRARASRRFYLRNVSPVFAKPLFHRGAACSSAETLPIPKEL